MKSLVSELKFARALKRYQNWLLSLLPYNRKSSFFCIDMVFVLSKSDSTHLSTYQIHMADNRFFKAGLIFCTTTCMFNCSKFPLSSFYLINRLTWTEFRIKVKEVSCQL
jgi:hypothetical protein